MISFILFVVGFILLIKGADLLVDGAVSIAARFRVSQIVIGLTVVSLGTSMPELIVNLMAAFAGQPAIALGNVFGSNIANVLLILGLTAVICPLAIKRDTLFSEIPFTLIAALLVGFLANISIIDQSGNLMLSRIEGFILLFFFGLYMLYILSLSREKKTDEDMFDHKTQSLLISLLYITIGILALFLGGKWVVDGAVKIAVTFGFSEGFIGLTLVAFGTSLPELVTSVVAAMKKNIDIAVGNVIGSNIFNILWVLGLSAVIREIPFDSIGNLDILVMVLSSTMIILAIALGKKNNLNRLSGVIFVFSYILYLFYLVKRG